MRRFLLLTFACALLCSMRGAETLSFTDNLVVTVDGEATPALEASISVEIDDEGMMNLSLSDFVLTVSGEDMYVGNIYVEGISLTSEDGYYSFSAEQTINITDGSDASVFWVGPYLGDVPLVISGKVTTEKMYCVIDIDMSSTIGQIINVVFGSDDFTSSVAGVRAADEVELVDVYTLGGVMVRQQVTKDAALEGLREGVYIVGGEKVVR